MAHLRLAVRTLFRAPFITLVASVSLALGIGANTAIFSLFNQLLLRELPVEAPDQLVNLANPGPPCDPRRFRRDRVQRTNLMHDHVWLDVANGTRDAVAERVRGHRACARGSWHLRCGVLCRAASNTGDRHASRVGRNVPAHHWPCHAAGRSGARTLSTSLFGVPPWDVGVLTVAAAVLAATALVASYLPARRASRIDPATTLASE